MSWFQIAQFIFYGLWLVGLLVVLVLIWRSSEARLKHIQNMEKTMFDVAMHTAESARKSVESMQSLVESIHVLVAMLQKEQQTNEPK